MSMDIVGLGYPLPKRQAINPIAPAIQQGSKSVPKSEAAPVASAAALQAAMKDADRLQRDSAGASLSKVDQAIDAYTDVANQERRASVQQMLGVDVYA